MKTRIVVSEAQEPDMNRRYKAKQWDKFQAACIANSRPEAANESAFHSWLITVVVGFTLGLAHCHLCLDYILPMPWEEDNEPDGAYFAIQAELGE